MSNFTRIYGYIVFIFIIILVIVIKCSEPEKKKETIKSTELLVVNETNDSVLVFLTIGSDTNYVTNVLGIYGIKTNGLQGSFILAPNDTVSYISGEKGFSGNLSFNTPPLNCPTNEFPLGINIFEFSLNNNFKGILYPQETFDISCVAGVNCRIGCTFDSLAYWTAGNGIKRFGAIENSFIYDNVGKIGVYPYGCDSCSQIYQPPICENYLKPSEPQKQNTCNIQRDANKKGGKVYVIYKGVLNGEIN
jgi:hypothetical protein